MSVQSSASTLSLKDIMENGFLISSSRYSFSSGSSCLLEMNSIPRTEAWNSASNMQNTSKDSSLALKVAESSSNGMKSDLQASCDGAASTPVQLFAFDLSNLGSANSKSNSTTDVFSETKSSTPCKEDKVSKLTENMLLKSSELNDSATFKKPLPPPVWEISGIQAAIDQTLSLEASIEELGFLGSMKTDIETSHFTVSLPGSGVPVHQASAL
ncbi:uncharacterized protein LOC100565258 [Anolis carolinensis]|uniref:uncharacterized protein LOC100565258 n=1 Tax=Anolis carolinensis TaxID=28377 RepID=UPI002F2B882C